MAGLDGRPMHFFPDYLVWYEADTGVSTKKKSSFSELLAQDVDRFYAMIQEQYSDNPYVKKQKRYWDYIKSETFIFVLCYGCSAIRMPSVIL